MKESSQWALSLPASRKTFRWLSRGSFPKASFSVQISRAWKGWWSKAPSVLLLNKGNWDKIINHDHAINSLLINHNILPLLTKDTKEQRVYTSAPQPNSEQLKSSQSRGKNNEDPVGAISVSQIPEHMKLGEINNKRPFRAWQAQDKNKTVKLIRE